jgi:hypothetical protein
MICSYCGKVLQDSKRTHSDLQEWLMANEEPACVHMERFGLVNQTIFPNTRPNLLEICNDCKYDIVTDHNKFILKQRLLR